MNLEILKKNLSGHVVADEEILKKYSCDASLFEVKPSLVVFPKNLEDIKILVNFAKDNKGVYLTARSGGTDMTGGPLGESIILVFDKYFNKVYEVEGNSITSEPGVYYRDFEKETLKKGLILPSFPASREICAIGGMVANNSG